jgi:NitT/TauT family transport system permease protein
MSTTTMRNRREGSTEDFDSIDLVEPEMSPLRRLFSAENLLTLSLLVAALGAWQLASMYVIGAKWISSPALVAARFGTNLANGSLVRNTVVTLEEALLGLVFGTAAGLVFGILLARVSQLVAHAVDPFILSIYSLPRIALAPFFILWFGIGLYSKVALVVSVAGFVVLFNIRQGIDTVDNDLVDALRSMRASRWQMIRYVTIPSLVPWLLAAVKICVGISVVSAVVGEMVGSTAGLGWYMTQTLNQFDMTGAMTALLTMAGLAMGVYGIVGLIERRVCQWQAPTGAARTVTT